MEELIAIIRELVQAVHAGEKRQEVLDMLDRLLKDMTAYASSDAQSTGKRKVVSSSSKVDAPPVAQSNVLDNAPFMAIGIDELR